MDYEAILDLIYVIKLLAIFKLFATTWCIS